MNLPWAHAAILYCSVYKQIFNAIKVRVGGGQTVSKHFLNVLPVFTLQVSRYSTPSEESHTVLIPPRSNAAKENILTHFRCNWRIWGNDKSIWRACFVSKLVEAIRCWLAPVEMVQLQARTSAAALSWTRSHVPFLMVPCVKLKNHDQSFQHPHRFMCATHWLKIVTQHASCLCLTMNVRQHTMQFVITLYTL